MSISGLCSTISEQVDKITGKIISLCKTILSGLQSALSSKKPSSLVGKASTKPPTDQTLSTVKQFINRDHSDQLESPESEHSNRLEEQVNQNPPSTPHALKLDSLPPLYDSPLGKQIVKILIQTDQLSMKLKGNGEASSILELLSADEVDQIKPELKDPRKEEDAPQETKDSKTSQEEDLPAPKTQVDVEEARKARKHLLENKPFKDLDVSFRNDRQCAKFTLKDHPDAILYVSDELKKDQRFLREGIKRNPLVYSFLIKGNLHTEFKYTEEDLEVLRKAAIQDVKDEEIAKALILEDPVVYFELGDELKSIPSLADAAFSNPKKLPEESLIKIVEKLMNQVKSAKKRR